MNKLMKRLIKKILRGMSLSYFILLFTVIAQSSPLTVADIEDAVRSGSTVRLINEKLVKDENYKDRNLLRRLMAIDDASVQEALVREVFPKIRELGLRYDVIRAAGYFVSADERMEFVAKARALIDSNRRSEAQELVSRYLNPEPPKYTPDGYVLVREFIGKGKYSYVSLLRRTSDGALFAWKRKTGAQAEKGDAFRKHVNLFSLWRALGYVSGEMFLLSINGQESILHSFVDGPTLKRVYASKNIFKDPSSLEFLGLVDLFSTLIANQIVLLDLNTKNIIFNGVSWEIIDSQRPKILQTPQETFRKLKRTITNKWSNDSNEIEVRDIDRLFDYIEKNMTTLLSKKMDSNKRTVVRKMAREVLDNHYNGELIEDATSLSCADVVLLGLR